MNSVHVEGDDAASVSHCALSMWWRAASTIKLAREKSDEGRDFRKLLEYVRVWLHNPREYLPYGLQFHFAVYHPDDVSELRRKRLERTATKTYAYRYSIADGGKDRRLQLISLGPVRCCYTYFKLSCFPSSSPIHIPAGEDRLRCPNTEELIRHMRIVRDELLQRNLRVKGPYSSEGDDEPVILSSSDIIPAEICIYVDDELKFPYHEFFGEKDIDNFRLHLCKHIKGKPNDPSCNAVLELPTRSGGLIRLWLQSIPPEHKRFKLAESALVRELADVNLQDFKKAIDIVNNKLMLMDIVGYFYPS